MGGVSRGFWSPFLDLGARSAIFWHLKTGTDTGWANHHHPHNDYNKMQVDEEKEEKDFYAAAADCPVVPEMGAMGLIG